MSSEKIAVLFPGQGSQYIGMGQEFLESSQSSIDIMAMAESVSGIPIKEMCLKGPIEELTLARNLQPALTATCLICWQALKDAGVQADFFAGHSLGEYTALCAAGVLSSEETMKLVTARGELMGQAGGENPGGMSAVLGLSLAEVQDILTEIACPEQISIGNHNSEQQVVLSGERDIVKKASDLVEERGGKAITLNVSVANHSPLMKNVVPEFEKVMAKISFTPPDTPVYFNVTAKTESDPVAIRAIMADQIKSMVKWLDIINALVNQDVKIFIEVGPKKVLTGLMKRILPRKSGHRCFQVDSPETLAKCVNELMN
jgi:[acyl-carrier-protein] S-malonyltransferase